MSAGPQAIQKKKKNSTRVTWTIERYCWSNHHSFCIEMLPYQPRCPEGFRIHAFVAAARGNGERKEDRKGERKRQSSKALAAARGNGERKEDREGGGGGQGKALKL